MSQYWDQLLFAHWPVKPADLRATVPGQFELDCFDGNAWIAVVPFLMNRVRFRKLPPLPIASSFLELNVRTYVKHRGEAGVYFFSLDASSRLAVEAARIWFGLPYLQATMKAKFKPKPEENEVQWIEYSSIRRDRRAVKAELKVRYRPTDKVFESEKGSLEEFLTERYRLFSVKDNRVLKGEVHHIRWPLQKAEAEFECNTMLNSLGLPTSRLGDPHLLYSKSLETLEWAPVTIEADPT
ncbi:DUF2071 domain-containing protein [bacterium]|nr:DUF2071 domain-containing protein [bacterium]